MNMLLHLFLASLTTVSQARHAGAPAENEVLRWNRVVTDALAAADTDPLTESRVLALVQLSVHDALNAIHARYATFGPEAGPAAGAASVAAISSAAHDALVELLPVARPALDEELARSLATLSSGDARSRGT